MRHAFVQPSGQDDNLGDSALRAGLLQALTQAGARLHVHLAGQTSDYVSGLPLVSDGMLYSDRDKWLRASDGVTRPVYVVNAGEIGPRADQPYPLPDRAREMERVVRRGGLVIAAGLGLKDLEAGAAVQFDPVCEQPHSSRGETSVPVMLPASVRWHPTGLSPRDRRPRPGKTKGTGHTPP